MSDVINLTQTITVLAIIIALILIFAWFFKRMNKGVVGKNSVIKVVSSMPLSLKEKIAVIEVGNKHLVIGLTPGSITTLHVFDEPIELENTTSSHSNSFIAHLNKFMKSGRQP